MCRFDRRGSTCVFPALLLTCHMFDPKKSPALILAMVATLLLSGGARYWHASVAVRVPSAFSTLAPGSVVKPGSGQATRAALATGRSEETHIVPATMVVTKSVVVS